MTKERGSGEKPSVALRSVAEDEGGLRLDRWFRQHFPALGHGRLEKLLRTGQVRLDGKRAKANARLEAGQVVRIPPLGDEAARKAKPAPRPLQVSEAEAAALEAALLYQDDWLIALNKPPGLAVQGGSKQARNLDAMLEQVRFGGKARPRLVHRLDRDTSGVLLLARTAEAARRLTVSFQRKDTRKIYWAVVAGVPRIPQGTIDLPLAKVPKRGGERIAPIAEEDPGAQPAMTHYAVAGKHGRRAAWLVLRPITGRTHQLRVHANAIGHPIIGDGKYGGQAAFLETPTLARRLHLHARELVLPHPEDGTTVRLIAPLPPHMSESWQMLGFDPASGETWSDRLAD